MTSHVSCKRVLTAISKTAFPSSVGHDAGHDASVEPSDCDSSDLAISAVESFASRVQPHGTPHTTGPMPTCRASLYPVILSLEMHCSPKQQRQLATILIEELGDSLLTVCRACTCCARAHPPIISGRDARGLRQHAVRSRSRSPLSTRGRVCGAIHLPNTRHP